MSSKIIAVDFDGCLCDAQWPEIGKAKQNVIHTLLQEQEHGAKLILWTCRGGQQLTEALAWCAEKGLVFDAVNDNLPENKEKYEIDSRKVFATEYWDDKAVPVEDDNVHGYTYSPPKKRWRDKFREIMRIIRE